MDPTQALGVVHADQLAQIIERVQRSPTGGRYVAACASHALRRRLEDALREALGLESVIPVVVDPTHPWNTVRQRQLALGRPLNGTLWTWWGLDQTEDVDPYPPLNFARDGMASTGTHNLFWLDGVREIGRFIEKAPDLWSYRSGVAIFISGADVPWEEPGPGSLLLEDLRRIDEHLHDIRRRGAARADALTRKAHVLYLLGRQREAAQYADEAVSVLGTDAEGAPAALWANAFARQITVRHAAGRLSEARELCRRLLAWGRSRGWSDVQYLVAEAEAVNAADAQDWKRAASLHERVAAGPPDLMAGGSYVPTANLVGATLSMGRPSRASARIAALPSPPDGDRAAHIPRASLQAALEWSTGATAKTLATIATAQQMFAKVGAAEFARSSRNLARHALWTLGLPDDWLILTRRTLSQPDATPGDHAAAAATLSNLPNPPPEAARWLDKALADLDLGAIDAGEEKLARIEELVRAGAEADGGTRNRLLEASLALLKQVPRPRPDPYGVSGYRDFLTALALVELGRLDEARVPAKSIIAWARHHRGCGYVVDGWLLLARIEAPATALRRADEALAEARTGEDLYRENKCQQARARALVALGRVEDARTALEAALAETKSEGLRTHEQELLCDLAEVPRGAERAGRAQDAVWLAREMMFPREEARALIALANLTPDPGERRQALERAQMWTAALGSAPVVRRLARVRGAVPSTG